MTEGGDGDSGVGRETQLQLLVYMVTKDTFNIFPNVETIVMVVEQ